MVDKLAIIEERLGQVEQLITKHLPGQHDQASHGRPGGGGGPARATPKGSNWDELPEVSPGQISAGGIGLQGLKQAKVKVRTFLGENVEMAVTLADKKRDYGAIYDKGIYDKATYDVEFARREGSEGDMVKGQARVTQGIGFGQKPAWSWKGSEKIRADYETFEGLMSAVYHQSK